MGPDRVHPRLLYRLTATGAELAPDLMQRQYVYTSPDLWEWPLKAGYAQARFRLDKWTRGEVNDLIYAGRAREARALVASSWPAGWPGEQDYWEMCLADLRDSFFWPVLREMNRGQW